MGHSTPGTGHADGAAEGFWEEHYRGHDHVWSGDPNPLLAETAQALTPGSALDLGCGEGADAVWLAARGWQVTAVDISAIALSRATDRAASAGVADRLTTERRDLALGFPSGAFDLISAQHLHTPFALPRTHVFRKAAHALTPGGLLLIVDHGSDRPWAWKTGPEIHYPAPEAVFGELDLDPARWRPERLDRPQRRATGPDGQTATVTDTVVAVRRLT